MPVSYIPIIPLKLSTLLSMYYDEHVSIDSMAPWDATDYLRKYNKADHWHKCHIDLANNFLFCIRWRKSTLLSGWYIVIRGRMNMFMKINRCLFLFFDRWHVLIVVEVKKGDTAQWERSNYEHLYAFFAIDAYLELCITMQYRHALGLWSKLGK